MENGEKVATAPTRVAPGRVSWLNRNVFALGITSFFGDVNHEMATAILPMFLSSLGASAATLGLIEGLADGLSSFSKLLVGWYSDRIGKRKGLAVIGYLITGGATGVFGLATSAFHVFLCRATGWIGRGIRTPTRDALLTDSVAAGAYGRAFGFHRAMDTVGAILGPLLAFALLEGVGYRGIFFLSLIPGVLAAATLGWFVRETPRPRNHALCLVASFRDLPRSFHGFVLAVGAFGLGNFAHSLLILRASELLGSSLGVGAAGAAVGLYTLHNILYALCSVPVGYLGDRWGKRPLLVLGYAIFGIMCIGFGLPGSGVPALFVLFVLAGVYIALVDAMEGALAAELLPAASRGTGFGLLATVNGIGDLISSMAVGLLWKTAGPLAGFGFAAAMSVVGAAALLGIPLRPAPDPDAARAIHGSG